MQIVAARPNWVRVDEIPADVLETERRAAEADTGGKPAAVVEKIIAGKLAKFYEENVLLEQPFIKDDSVKVKQLLTNAIGRMGENIVVRRFSRIEVGG
jgi:elongation factor Ts